ncbi:hypothetical protein EJ05DRAFT_478642 [Pseudovirgaria hyperparasitica]|uniref:Conserved oligomeric Golgi complex subunit 1 n=1 Tax=Pseudovirgaria hyperparasitica TaxID=470096 RepID=A0A6A6W3R1_9PEZI|nr:uncharacterized protein EJ05DRAFT_478642 [Pseudovirgaria hyperparasitica]KAF2755681.1 hypothetical protein EJ05DRAFT_478642 [Pseudovirgaria hyperparasitica]
MATEAPDPRTFKSWEDAFEYPVPVVRKLEAQLRSSANDNRERLRSLVGASYRDLLGTAERIVDMDQTMGQVENALAQIGTHCSSGLLEKVTSNYAMIDQHWRTQREHQNAFASQLAMLQACPTVIARQLKQGGSLLLASKILVLSRLLHKALTQSSSTSPLSERAKERLGYLRGRLISRISKQCSDPTLETEALIDNLCAYSLATSSTPTNVLNRFHQVRLESLNGQFDHKTDIQDHILKALNICVTTLHETRAIFPRQISQALLKLKARPLIQASDVQAVTELNLPIHQRWLADEVRNYTPWSRHDELNGIDVERLTKEWARQAMKAFVTGLDKVLSKISDLRKVVKLRQDILETWFPASRRAPGLDPQRVLDHLRDVLNKHTKLIAQRDVLKLSSVTDAIGDYLEHWNGDVVKTAPLWSLGIDYIDLSDGAEGFKKSVIERGRGRSQPVEQIIATYDAWADSVANVRRVIREMRDLRWDDDFDDDDDDEMELDSKQTLLSQDDPRSIEEALYESSEQALSQIRRDLESIAERIVAHEDTESRVGQTIFVLRTLREVSQRLPKSAASTHHESHLVPEKALQLLHQTVAASVIVKPQDIYKVLLNRFVRRKVISGRQLWEGNPALPSFPSPATYKFLHALSSSMTIIGPDIWSPEAVKVLKEASNQSAVEALKRCARQVIFESESEKLKADSSEDDLQPSIDEASHASLEDKKTRMTNKLLQLIFDSCYLSQALSSHNSTALLGAADMDQQGISKAMFDQIARNATEYWKRTYLMFALLS